MVVVAAVATGVQAPDAPLLPNIPTLAPEFVNEIPATISRIFVIASAVAAALRFISSSFLAAESNPVHDDRTLISSDSESESNSFLKT